MIKSRSFFSFNRALVVLVGFIVSRLFFWGMGIQMDDSPGLGKMFQLLDLNLLESNLGESVLYLHCQPPLFNFFIGMVIKCFPEHPFIVFQALYFCWGIILHLALYYLFIQLGFSQWISVLAVYFFMLCPSTILFESWLFYTYPVAGLLCLSAYLFYRFHTHQNVWWGMSFFFSMAAICLTRSIFHVGWLVFITFILIVYVDQCVICFYHWEYLGMWRE